jgi:hypothetical protein
MTRTTLLAFGIFSFSGCVVDSTHSGFHGTATLDVAWTVDGTTDPAQCRQGGATQIDIIVETHSGRYVGDFTADCADFDILIDLDPGQYQATAVLLDDRGHDRTTAVQIDPFDLFEGDTVPVDVDFPADSFL